MIFNFQIKILILNFIIINLFICSLLVSIRKFILSSRSNPLLLIIWNNKLLVTFLNRIIKLLFIILKTLIIKSLQRIWMFIFFDESIYKINWILKRILGLIIIKLIKHRLFFKIISLVTKWIIILIINIFHLQIINPPSLFLWTFWAKSIGLKNRQTRLRLDIVFNPMVKSIVNNWTIR